MSKIFTLLALFTFATSCLADQSAPSCGVFLARSTMLQNQATSEDANDFQTAYLNLLSLVLEGIDKLETNTLDQESRAQIKIQLLQNVLDSSTPFDLIEALRAKSRATIDISKFSALLSALADNGPLDYLLENLSPEDWQKIRQAVQQMLAQLLAAQNAQLVAKPSTQIDFLDVPDFNGDLKIHRLIKYGKPDEIHDFLDHAHTTPRYLNTGDKNNNLPLDLFMARFSRQQLLRNKLRDKGALTSRQLYNLSKNVETAIYRKQPEKIRELYEAGADINSALPGAIERGRIAELKTLWKLGAVVTHGDPPLHRALVSTTMPNEVLRREVVHFLIQKGEDLTQLDSSGYTPFMWAVSHSYIDLFDTLNVSEEDFYRVNNLGNSVMHIAALKGATTVIRRLYEMGGHRQLQNKSRFDRTPIYAAVEKKHLAAIRLLYELGASFDSIDSEGKTPRDFAKDKSVQKLIHKLMRKSSQEPK